MPDTAAAPRRREVCASLLGRCLQLLGHGVMWLVFALLVSILIEWIGLRFWWPEQGIEHGERMLAAELGYLQADFRRSLVSPGPEAFAKRMIERSHYLLFELTRIDEGIEWISKPATPDARGIRPKLHASYRGVATYLRAAIKVTQVFSVRLAILILALPVFALFSLVAIVDGLVQRDLRRWGGGRESSFIYHWAKRSALPLLVGTWVIYLALPFSVHPSYIVLPCATLYALSVAVTAGAFKKYL